MGDKTEIYSKFSFRKANIDDLEQLISLGVVAYQEYANFLTPENWNVFKAGLSNKASRITLIEMSEVFVCAYDNKVIGMAYWIPSGQQWDVFQSDWSYIRMVGVHPDYRGFGIGQKLMKQCINLATQKAEKIVALHTSELMFAARHIYDTLDFKIKKELEPRYGMRYWLYTLAL